MKQGLIKGQKEYLGCPDGSTEEMLNATDAQKNSLKQYLNRNVF